MWYLYILSRLFFFSYASLCIYRWWNLYTLSRCIKQRWLQLVGSWKLYVSFAKEPYKRDYILQTRPTISRSLRIIAIPYNRQSIYVYAEQTIFLESVCTNTTKYWHIFWFLIRQSTSPKSTKSKNSDSSVSRSTQSNWDFCLISICTVPFEFLDLVGFGDVVLQVESVIHTGTTKCIDHRCSALSVETVVQIPKYMLMGSLRLVGSLKL